ncbi:helix-turn-helix domain-containing protein [Virgisporangium aurantiacum]|uniref:AraC family transcriptional regulator n=1 Tax=Virgisporangium aurantiacum TaxID=175570 RepID=A0A8J4E6M9_9ACTN|nr:helix-turn-helix domain-containing protein [Virgisporangium aurantiacum]GIJ63399.1 AraC family transcriptional regulator [Virgisporangium aurantiacum]
MVDVGRDRLRELLDAVLADGESRTLEDMAGDAFVSPFHFSRLLSRQTHEPPVAMRRRVLLERAAWQLRHGSSVADAAWAAGYDSVEGFSRAYSRAFGHPPSRPAARHWLPAPNGIHFHPPISLWVDSTEHTTNPLTEQMVRHDLDDTRALLEYAKGLTDAELRAVRLPGAVVLPWDGGEETIDDVLANLVWAKEIWLASIEGRDTPQRFPGSELLDRHDAVAASWLAMVRDLDARGAWNDRLIDALCDPPESFVMSSVVAHVLTYSAHRRQLVRHMLRAAGHTIGAGDPIMWLRRHRNEETTGDDLA